MLLTGPTPSPRPQNYYEQNPILNSGEIQTTILILFNLMCLSSGIAKADLNFQKAEICLQ